MLTARSDETDKLIGLELGTRAVHYQTLQPQGISGARPRGVSGRIENYSEANTELLHAADLTLDLPRMGVVWQPAGR